MSISSTVPVGQPLPGASFGQSVQRFFKGYVKFSGRASRSEFWWAMLFTFLVSLVVQIPFWIVWAAFMAQAVAMESGNATTTDGDMAALSGGMLAMVAIMALVSMAIVLPTYAVMWRRLQDANFHGAFTLLSLVGFGIVPLVMCALPSNPLGARFDPAYAGQVATYGYDQPYTSASPAYGQTAAYGQTGPYSQTTEYGQATEYGQPAAYGQAAPYGRPAYGQQPDGQPSQPYSQGYQQGTSAIPQSYGGQSYGGTPYGQQADDRQQ